MFTKTQKQIIKDNQQKHLKAAISNNNVALVITKFGKHTLIETKKGNLLRATNKKNIKTAVAGDKVSFQKTDDNSSLITALLKRKNKINYQKKTVAANIDNLWIVVAIKPHFQYELIDRYLISAFKKNIKASIIVNKIDIVADTNKLYNNFDIYKKIGYKIYYTSAKKNQGINALIKKLNNKNNIFVGQSGVGKSSLINKIIPNLNITTREISKKTNLGKHTTSNTRLYHILSGGNLIDSPGIREFSLSDLNDIDILNGYIEFNEFSANCQFRNCSHINEINCAIKKAVNENKISEKRYQNYLTFSQNKN